MTNTRPNDLLKELQHILVESEANLMELSRVTGVSYNTLRALKAGTANPTINLLERIYSAAGKTEKPEKTCQDCEFCLNFDTKNNCYNCELQPSAWKEDPTACIFWMEHEQ